MYYIASCFMAVILQELMQEWVDILILSAENFAGTERLLILMALDLPLKHIYSSC